MRIRDLHRAGQAQPESSLPLYHHHLAHWGVFEAESDGQRILSVRPYGCDPEPYPLIDNLPIAQYHSTRIDHPASSLYQAPTGQHSLVEVMKHQCEPPVLRIWEPPRTLSAAQTLARHSAGNLAQPENQ